MQDHPPQAGQPVQVPELHHGDVIHVLPHAVFRHTEFAHLVACQEADVVVDALITVESVIVISWRGCSCPGVYGAVVYDADDSVERRVAVA